MNFVNKLKKSRGVIIEMLELRGFDVINIKVIH